jgi:hypothetical protein
MSAPKLLSSSISVALPSVITSLFPICAALAKSSPATGRLVAVSTEGTSLILGSSVALKDGAPVSTAAATVSAEAGVFAENTEVQWQ